MNALAERIASCQHGHQPFRKGLNDRDLQGEPRVIDARGKRPAVAQEVPGAARKLADGAEQGGGRGSPAQLLHLRAGLCQDIERNVDAVEIAVIFAAILPGD
jgi:hypothetical protein